MVIPKDFVWLLKLTLPIFYNLLSHSTAFDPTSLGEFTHYKN